MYAIIRDGGNQYRVEEGVIMDIERRDLPDGADSVVFEDVLMVGDLEGGPMIGRPVVEGAKVTARVLKEVKGDKITIQKFRRRKNYARKKGHRQRYLRIAVTTIEAPE